MGVLQLMLTMRGPILVTQTLISISSLKLVLQLLEAAVFVKISQLTLIDGNCEALVNVGPPASGPVDGIQVKRCTSSSRVRISVPNCGDTMLVMWVFCVKSKILQHLI